VYASVVSLLSSAPLPLLLLPSPLPPPSAAMSRPARAPALDQSRTNHEHARAHHFGHAEAEEIMQYPHLQAGSVAYGVDKFVEYGQLKITRQQQQFVGFSSVFKKTDLMQFNNAESYCRSHCVWLG
jgi:hypothetical protein